MRRTVFQRPGAQKMVRVLPNFLTLGNLCLGMGAVLLATLGDRLWEAIFFVLAGMLLDGLDGRAARMLNSESSFGAQLDSLADVVTFGVAPSVIIYTTSLHELGFLGGLASVAFTACSAIRLARFNVQPGSVGWFRGLPTPVAGGALVALSADTGDGSGTTYPLMASAVVLGLLMVSRVGYPKIRRFRLRGSHVLVSLLFLVAVAAAAFSPNPAMLPRVIAVPLGLYILYGIGCSFLRRSRSEEEEPEPAEECK